MDFKLNDSQKAIVKSARDFAYNDLLPGVLERDRKGEYDINLWKKLGELGFLGLPYPKEYGGTGNGYLEYVLALQEISKVDASVGISYSISTSVCCGGIYNYGNEEQKKKYLPALLNGESIGAFGLTEAGAGSDASNLKTVAEEKDDHYLLNGTKIFTTNGPYCKYYFVIASTDPTQGVRGLSAFVVDTDWEGVTVGAIEDKMGLRSAQVSDMHFNNVKVPKENLLGEKGKGFVYAMESLDCGRVGIAAQALGIAKGAFNEAFEYIQQREQFGKPIYKNQYVSFKMAELKTKIQAAEFMLYNAAVLHDEGLPFSEEAAMAKLMCSDVAMEVTVEAVQFMGGNGYMKPYHVERMMRDAKITQIYEGTNEIQKLVISNSMFRKKK
ncbi:acyl-CoA dehydrogenase family protein [Peptoniphilus stercorisuis]|uniref:Butyryl-CoA dehydrogenase n=1 Tax=Peptoniphilus stercorisuis TaxID=1436965 RepID=A0ABS4KAY8_9FIRM|nr:acyl-CoA dehydrogenase family protein [Peptoniphilus stercorisuis]MBP2024941.1 butyryl-CoA dehydrogenase [Peptoniphilus stercorisuis]